MQIHTRHSRPAPTARSTPDARRRATVLVAVSLTLVGAGLLSACRGPAEVAPEALEAPEPALAAASVAQWTQASLPAGARFAGRRVAVSAAVGSTPSGLPEMLLGVSTEGDGADQAHTWTVAPGRDTWPRVQLPVPGDGDETPTAAHFDGTTTWATGYSSEPGRRHRPWLASSTDRTTWSAVDLPAAALDAAFEPNEATDVGGAVALFGMTRDFGAAMVTHGTDGTLTPLPAAPDGRDLHGITGAAVSGRTVVLTGFASTPGDLYEGVVYRSGDGGRTWSVTIGPGSGNHAATGVVASGGRFVATGWTAQDSVMHVAAWSSADGQTWTGEPVPDRGDDVAPGEEEDGWLSGPAVAGDSVVAAYTLGSTTAASSVRRDASGAWTLLAPAEAWEAPGTDAVVAGNPDGSFSLTQVAYNGARMVEIGADGTQQPRKVPLGSLNTGEDLSLVDTSPGDGPLDILGSRTTVSTSPDGGWSRSNTLARYSTDAAGDVTHAPWDPAETQDLVTLVQGTAADGSQVTLGTTWVDVPGADGSLNLTGWFRPAAAAPWQPATGLAEARHDHVNDVQHTSAGWVAVGSTHAPHFGDQYRYSAAAWTSADGVHWTRVAGTFDGPESESGDAQGVCGLPGGGALVVGNQSEGGVAHPRAWLLKDGTWAVADASAFGGGPGWLTSCTADESGLLVQGSSGRRSSLWSGTELSTLTRAELGGRDDDVGAVTAIPGGFAAAGSHGSDGHTGAVLWVSRDARTWVPVPVPTHRWMTAAQVKVVGGQLAVVLNSPTSSELWYLANPGAVLATL